MPVSLETWMKSIVAFNQLYLISLERKGKRKNSIKDPNYLIVNFQQTLKKQVFSISYEDF